MDLEELFTRESVVPNHSELIRFHSHQAMVQYRGRRPVLSARHVGAVRALSRAFVADRDDPQPEGLET